MPIARKYAKVIPRQSDRVTLASLILEKIGEAGETFLDIFFPAKYPEARLWRSILGLDPSYEFKRRTFTTILSQLKSQGLVSCKSLKGRWYWQLTSKGRLKLREYGKRKELFLKPDGKKRIVAFDIPERDRAKRRWLRGELLALGYRPLQKSVWLGETPLPSEFIKTLDVLDLRDKVHIFMVSSEGTLIRNIK